MLGTLRHGRYTLIKVLGAGGFGQTFLAEDTQHPDRRYCVVKQFKPSSQDSRFLEIARRLFDTEVDALERLGKHDQIPELYDSFEENGEFYLVQEFIDGHPLSDEISRTRRMNEAEVIAMLEDVLSVLEFVHQNRVIHRDIKPGNLIRRHRDGKIVLIDFGAVKELGTQLMTGTGQTSFTVGIGTHGYTPAEQLAGKPRYCSDIYGLGVTAIQALTGLSPSHLTEDPDTSELIWQDDLNINPGLAIILNQMVRFHYSRRFQTATDVLQALKRMSELPTDMTEIPPSMLLPKSMLQDQTLVEAAQDWRKKAKLGVKVVAIASLAVTALLWGVRQIGWTEPLELSAYDHMVRMRSDSAPDPRLLVVTIDESDLQALQRPTPSDQDLATVIKNLASYQPRVIGVDLYRDIPQQPGQAALLDQLRAPNVVSIMNLGGGSTTTKIPPPPRVPDTQVGFNDLPIDPDGVIRRNLLFASTESGYFYSFALRVALRYLAAQEIKPQNSPDDPNVTMIGDVIFPPLEPTSGGYQNADAAGYQILLNYRSGGEVAPEISFTDALQGKIDPALVRDKVVIIGTTAASSKDLFNTPFSSTSQEISFQMPGVIVHTQMVSQLLSITLNDQPLIWFFPNWLELVWIAGWAIAGGCLAWFVRHPVLLGVGGGTILVLLMGSSLLLFTRQGWVPVAAPAIATILTGAAVGTYCSYRTQQQQKEMTQLLWRTGISDGIRKAR